MVIFTAIEDGDTVILATRATTDITDRARQLGVATIVIYPYVRLTESPAPIPTAKRILDQIAEGFSDGLKILRVPFGWYKGFELSSLGHPLSEWIARYDASEDTEAEKDDRKGSGFVRYVIVDASGES